MSRIVIFDLYDTLLNESSFDFERGLGALYELGFGAVCTRQAFLAYAAAFLPLYEKRKTDNTEVKFLDEYRAYCKRFRFQPEPAEDDVEYAVMRRMAEVSLSGEVTDTLAALAARNTSMYILTNSIFSAQANKRLLQEFGLRRYFQDLYSSADAGMRKPAKAFFDYGIGRILAENPETRRGEIYFVGNDYDSDVSGAAAAGLRPVWYRAAGRETGSRRTNAGIRVIETFQHLIDIVQ